ncbi:hypothetical protein QJS04_geneDACA002328 [Acorus gramineus]|uniref:Uncharacterized protein n=1 Tax=Acorus gramineus TaxID=55184 RepID=A0AAV9A9D2_ACOGR|nr:hypothetical protein QJS04_geneDACA002328 [Acorus gramineus]
MERQQFYKQPTTSSNKHEQKNHEKGKKNNHNTSIKHWTHSMDKLNMFNENE